MDISGITVGAIITEKHPLHEALEPSKAWLEMLPIWEMCRDTDEGAWRVKQKGVRYLPPLESHMLDRASRTGVLKWYNGIMSIMSGGGWGATSEGLRRYEDYKDRAVFYGAVGLTVDAFINMIYRKAPSYPATDKNGDAFELDEQFREFFFKNASSYRESLTQFLTRLSREYITTNYVGILEDRGDKSKKSFSVLYKAEQIQKVEYRTDDEGYYVPDYIVLREGSMEDIRLRMLLLDKDGLYWQIVFAPDIKKKNAYVVESMVQPTIFKEDSATTTEPFKNIPFWLFGELSAPRIYDLAEMALGYYRNSADRENEQHMVSIKTAIFPGWDREECGDPALGGALTCPPNTEPYIMEAKTESQLKEAMAEKVENCARLGSNILSGRGKYLQAKETAEINVGGDTSTVEAMSMVIQDKVNEILKLKLRWMGEHLDKNIKLSLNAQYFETGLNPNFIATLVKALQGNVLSFDAFFHIMEDGNMYPDDWTKDKEIRAIEKNPLPDFTDSVLEGRAFPENDIGSNL